MASSELSRKLSPLVRRMKSFFGSTSSLSHAERLARLGLGLSGGFMILVGVWFLIVEPDLLFARALSVGLLAFGSFNILSALRNVLSLLRVNQFSLAGYLVSIISLYLFLSRITMVSYTTDTVVGIYMGLLKVLQLQSPYVFSIRPFLDQFGFSPSFYTPGVDGSFDFHLAYPSLSFLSVLPFYALGLHDVRDTIFIFHILSVLLIFGLAPARLKSVSLAPFGLFPVVIAGSWTDSVWAFFLVLTALLWYRHPKISWVTLGLAVAVKQIPVVVAPFLLIRLWYESPQSRLRALARATGLMLAAFFLPNLPFILASPGAWWNAIVAPYLPNSPPQVPGGIGLSNSLLDLGIALPSPFFLVLMLATTGVLFYLYATHFQRLNKFVYSFPILLFFFYYRSFPNYMIYWLFPFVLELCQYARPGFKLPLLPRMKSVTWRPRTGRLLNILRQRLTPSVILSIILTMAFVGASGAYISGAASSRAEIRINSAIDPDSIGAVTLVNVTLRNLSSTPVMPTFFVKWGPLPYVWTSNSTGTLPGYSEDSFVISPTDALAAVPRGIQFHVLVYDKTTEELLGESVSARADIPAPALINPHLRWWALDVTAGRKVPFGWRLTVSNINPAASGIEPLGENGTQGVQIRLNSTSISNLPQELVLSQRILFNPTKVNVVLNQSLTTSIANKLMFGATVTDGSHTLSYIFSDTVSTTTVTAYAANATIIIPTAASKWTSISLDPESFWNSQTWTLPQQVTLSFFLETESPGVYCASLSEVTPVQTGLVR